VFFFDVAPRTQIYSAILMTSEDSEIEAHVNQNTIGDIAWVYDPDSAGTFVNGVLNGAFPDRFKVQVYYGSPQNNALQANAGWLDENTIGINMETPFGLQNYSIRIEVYS